MNSISGNITLLGQNWGTCEIENLCRVFRCTVDYFESILLEQYKHNIPCRIEHWENDHPQCSGNSIIHIIFLTSENRCWDKHTFQFAHEYCHHLINIELTGNKVGAFWFEETICELASLYCLIKNANTWKSNPPYPNWIDYAPNFTTYYKNEINEENVPISKLTIAEFIKENIAILEQPEYQRGMYTYIAKGIIDIFIVYPSLWNIILLFRNTNYRNENYKGFEAFLNELEVIIPPEVKGYGLLKRRLLG